MPFRLLPGYTLVPLLFIVAGSVLAHLVAPMSVAHAKGLIASGTQMLAGGGMDWFSFGLVVAGVVGFRWWQLHQPHESERSGTGPSDVSPPPSPTGQPTTTPAIIEWLKERYDLTLIVPDPADPRYTPYAQATLEILQLFPRNILTSPRLRVVSIGLDPPPELQSPDAVTELYGVYVQQHGYMCVSAKTCLIETIWRCIDRHWDMNSVICSGTTSMMI